MESLLGELQWRQLVIHSHLLAPKSNAGFPLAYLIISQLLQYKGDILY